MIPDGFVTLVDSLDSMPIVESDVRAIHQAGYAALVTVQRLGGVMITCKECGKDIPPAQRHPLMRRDKPLCRECFRKEKERRDAK